MLGLDEKSLSLSFDMAFADSVDKVREGVSSFEEIVGFHQDEFPIASKALKRIEADAEKLNLSADEFYAASCLAILKVIEINNLTIEKQLQKAGVFL